MGFIQQHIYPKLPLFLQNLLISAYGYSLDKRRYGGIFEVEYKKAKDREKFSKEQWHEYQTIELRKILLHAFNSVPFYYQKYSAIGITAENLSTFELSDLPKLPFLEKEELRKFGKSILLSSHLEKGGKYLASSGSTGTPVNILFSLNCYRKWMALYEARVRNWAGLSRKNSRGMIGGRRILPGSHSTPPFYRYNSIEKQVYFSAYHLSPSTVNDYVEGLKKYSVEYMVGYAFSNYLLAKLIVDQGIHAPELKAVLVSSEKLTQEMRDMLKIAYNCKTFDAWSGVEACGLISETSEGELLCSPDSAILEFLNNDLKPVELGSSGEVVCTGLLNYDQPLIRYRIGDSVILDPNQGTRCGRAMPKVKEIMGRTEDIITGPDGRQMVRFHSIFIDLPNVRKGQLVQKDIYNYHLRIESKPARLTKAEKEMMTKRMKSQLGDEIQVTFEELASIPLTPNGKFKAVFALKKN
ncbi:phenylacetate--CoA ligase family protein [Nitrospira sp. Ecomares 2.1]